MQTITPNLNLNPTKLSASGMEEYAEMFCEGSKSLKDLLLYLWKKGINTYACCAGHLNENKSETPYVLLEISTFKPKQLEKLIKLLLIENKNFTETNFSFDAFNGERHTVIIRLNNKQTFSFIDVAELIEKSINNLSVNSEFKKWCISSKFQKSEEELNHVIQSIVKLNNINLQKYHNNSKNPGKTFGKITFKISKDIQIEVSDNFKKFLCTVKENNQIVETYYLVKGYVTKTNQNEYITLNGEDIVQISEQNAKKFPNYVQDKKYNDLMEYSQQKVEEIINELMG